MGSSPTWCATPATRGFSGSSFCPPDVARRTMLSRYGGKGYPTVLRDFVPMLKERGISDAAIETMLSDNPRRMLTFCEITD